MISLIAASVLAPQAVFSAEEPDADEAVDPLFAPLTFDVMLGGGISSELYLHGEPAFDLGIARLGQSGGLGLGAGIDVGWCALCGFVSALTDISWSGTFYSPFARVTVHAGTLGGLLPRSERNPLDLYLGVLSGPSFYKFVAGVDGSDTSVTHRRFTLRIAPLIGARLGLGGNRFLLFAEYRYNIEGGFSAVTYTGPDGDQDLVAPETVNRRGNEFIAGIGIRI